MLIEAGADVDARSEPVLAITVLAGIAAILLVPAWGTVMDDSTVDLLVLVVVTFVGGLFYGAAGYFVLGLALWLGAKAAGVDPSGINYIAHSGGGEAIGGEGRDAVSVAGDGDWKVNDARALLVQADEITTLGSIEFAAVTGGPGSNLISGGSFTGNLRLKGRGGGDLLQAGEGDDLILGGDGNDFVQAGSGDDELEGGPGDDSLGGESGNDELRGGGGDDTCRGGPGADSFASC